MRRIGAVVLLGLFATATQSCQDAAGTGPATPISELPAMFATGICQGYAKCGGVDDVELQKNCVPRLTAMFTESFGPIIEMGIASTTILYNADFVAECRGQLADCGATNQMPVNCISMLKGAVAEGDACTADMECQGESMCVPGVGGSCPGECHPLGAVGADCTDDDQCARGLKCNAAEQCEIPLAQGDACADNDECDYYLVCIDADGTGPAGTTCEAMPGLKTAGFDQECGASVLPPAAPLCASNFSCADVDGEGRCMGNSAAGASCKPGFPDPCPQNSYCDATTCAPLPQKGEPCVTYSLFLTEQCAAGFFCDVSTICQPLLENEAACDAASYDGEDCVSGNCRDDVCDGAYACDSAG